MPILYFVVCGGIIAIVFALVHLPLVPVLYALGLCAFLGVVFLGVGYIRFRRRFLLLATVALTDSLDHLPKPDSPLEETYQMQLEALFMENQQRSAQASRQYQDMLEYYTLWVHQIKTPISAMDLILQAGDGAENQELKGELYKIRQYVEMVLSYLRLGSDSTDFVFRKCALDDLVRSAVRNSSGQFIRQKVQLDFQETYMTILTDEKWLLFVLEQLISNCLKYAPGGLVSISADDSTTLAIRDTGIGIAAEDLPRVFEKGYTGLNGRRDRSTTGIGLYLCKEIMKKLGHGISVTSQPGQGTCVYLTFQQDTLCFDEQ